MKNTTIITLAALAFGATGAIAQEAYTKPTGFVTHSLKSGQFNLVGLTLHKAVTVAGTFSAVSGTLLTDSDVDFSNTLTSGATYVLEITEASDPELDGTIQEITVWSGNTITTPQDLGADGLVAGDKYQIRAVSTIADVFGTTNTEGLQGGTASTLADNIYVANAQGGFDVFFYSTGGFTGVGWRQVGEGSTDFADQVLFPTDGFYIFRRGADLDLVHTGAVKTESTNLAVTQEFTFVSGVFPVGSTFASSQLEQSLTGGTASALADNILIQTENGTFDTYYYSTGGFVGIGWRKVGDGNNDQSAVELPSAFVIKRVNNSDFNVQLVRPDNYEDL